MRTVVNTVIAGGIFLAGLAGGANMIHVGDTSLKRADELTIVDVYCPAEDSCHIEYDDKKWSVRRLAPSQI